MRGFNEGKFFFIVLGLMSFGFFVYFNELYFGIYENRIINV